MDKLLSILKQGIGFAPPPPLHPIHPPSHPPGHVPRPRHRGPAYRRRQERRQAVKTDAGQAEQEVVAEEANNNEKVIEEKESGDKAEQVLEFKCELCDFSSNWNNGLAVHMSKKHNVLEQLDGHAEVCDISDDEKDKYLSTKHYWKSGYLGSGYQTYLDACDLVDEMNFKTEEFEVERDKVLEARRAALGKDNYKYYPPWS